MHIEFRQNGARYVAGRWLQPLHNTIIRKLDIEDWLDETMPDVKYKCIIFNNRIELRFTDPSHYTEFALRYTNHEFRIVQ